MMSLIVAAPGLEAQDLVITGVIDGPLTGGVPKAVEFYTLDAIPDLSIYGFGGANNGGGSDGEEFTFPAVSVGAGTCLWVASEATGFTSFFGFAPDWTSAAASINGDDAIELFQNGTVVDVFGEIDVDGSGQPWEYMDGWAYRQQSTGPDGSTFVIGNWYFSGPNALDGETSNSTAAVPFPIGFYGGCAPPPPPAPDLLLTEIVVTPTAGEFIEIHNPTVQSIDLSDVYLTDATFAGGGTYYYNIVTGANAGGGGFGDFHARFPDGASIGPGEYQTVALPGSDDFVAEYGFDPDYELFEDGGVPDAIPDMREALPGSINGQGGLSNSGEVVILYTWDGASDLVSDIDYGLWGDKAEAVDKTGVSIDGPDSDSSTSTYLPDTAIPLQDVVNTGSHNGGDSFQRIDLAEGTETQSGGNGVTGSDETSENLSVTWASDSAPTPGGAYVPPTPPSVWIINEIHADPASGIDGDANGDGVRDSSEDEFVEIVNISGGAVDISGWTLADGFSVRHTFPAGTVVEDQCGVVVFGGGTPTGPFGGMTVQTASTGTLGLNNSGDTVTLNSGSADEAVAAYGSEGGDNQSLTLDPDLTGAPWTRHSVASGSGGSLFSPGTMIDGSQFGGCPLVVVELREIYEIQGDGLVSPFVGQTVRTEDNAVTALATDGFFIQTPDFRSDGNVDTSDGIFVFTDSAPTVAVGDRVDVTGSVAEFFFFTELNSPTVTILGAGSVPQAINFNATVPSLDPTFPSCAIEFECYEGMLVEVAEGTVTGPNQRFGSDPFAEMHIVAYLDRAFREPGVEFPGLGMPSIPTWDGNPEVFELDPDKLGLPNQILPAGSTFSATGVLGFEFGGYELWPTGLTVIDPVVLPRMVWPREPGEFTVATLNLFRLFDDMDDPPSFGATGEERNDFVANAAAYTTKLVKLSAHIREVLDAPDVLAVQEAEKLGVLEDLAAQIATDEPGISYTAYLIEGNDVGTIDIGFMVRDRVTVDSVTQLGYDELFSWDGSPLHDRPPLLLEGSCQLEFGSSPISVLGVHNRSLSGIDDSSDGERVRLKRYEQAESIATMIQDLQITDPGIPLAVVGDFNAFEFTDGYVDSVGIIKGDFEPAESLICATEPCADLVEPDLTNQVLKLLPDERYSFIFRGSAQVLDHALTSVSLDPEITALTYGRGNADAAVEFGNDDFTSGIVPLRASDHDGLVLYLLKDEDGDGVPNNLDYCPATVIPESVPTVQLGTNRWALVDGDGYFDTTAPNGKGPKRSYSVADTAGCSCEQIIDALGLGKGHQKFGCSNGAMDNWVDFVQQ